MSEQYITPDQLCIGLYIHLDLKWMDHPFTFNSFKIKTQEQIDLLKQMRLTRIRYEPKKSAAKPGLSSGATPHAPTAEQTAEAAAVAQVLAKKNARIAELRTIRDDIDRVEQKFVKVADAIKNITRMVQSDPERAFLETNAVVKQMVETMLANGDVVLHALSEKLGEDTYFHSLNVSVLSLMLGKSADLQADTLQQLGVGALLHDIGKTEIPHKVLMKIEPLNKAEQALVERHGEYGLSLGAKMGLSDVALSIIAQHHEYEDGSGSPSRLRSEQIHTAAKIVSIVNSYDNLCNPVNIATALTPSEALSQMFAFMRAKFDDRLLKLFIRRLGIYPPGSLVQLSNDMIGLVVSVNSEQPLKPNVLVYDQNVPQDEALIISLDGEADLKVAKSLRVSQLPREVHRYLNPRKHVTYYFDPKKRESAA